MSEIANITVAIGLLEESFTITKESLPSSKWALEEDYKMLSGNVRIVKIIHNKIFSDFPTANSKGNYVRYIRIGKMLIR